ncbi:MAG: sulfotransferase [Nitrososphaerales archaeon]
MIILGMRRSGTSLVASLAESLGFFFEKDSRSPDQHNPRGYFESRTLDNMNTGILSELGGDTHSPPSLREGWQELPAIRKLQGEATRMLSEYSKHEKWGLKGSKLCLTLPFWKPLFESEMYYLLCVRNPLATARSWKKMAHALQINLATESWYTFMAHALVNTANERRLLVYYEDFAEDAKSQTSKICDFLGLRTEKELSYLYSQDLERNRVTPLDLANETLIPDKVKMLYALLLEAKSNPSILSYLDQTFKGYSGPHPPWRVRLRYRMRSIGRTMIRK